MRTSEVLHKAADLIQERGWVQGDEGMLVDPGSRLCLMGAIGAAVSAGQFGRYYSYYAIADCPAAVAVASHLEHYAADYLWKWNDYHAQSADAVVEVLRATAVIEAAKEDEAIAAEFLTWQGSEISA